LFLLLYCPAERLQVANKLTYLLTKMCDDRPVRFDTKHQRDGQTRTHRTSWHTAQRYASVWWQKKQNWGYHQNFNL